MRKSYIYFFTLLSIALLATGCGQSQEALPKKEGTRVIQDAQGKVEIPKDPKRIADISGSSEELLILGHEPVATANTDSYDHKKPAPYIKERLKNSKIVGFYMLNTIDIEGVLETQPDLILINQRQMKIHDQLKKIAPVVVVKGDSNQWRVRFQHIGEILGQKQEVADWVAQYEQKAKQIGDKIKAQSGKQSFAVILADRKKNYLFGEAGIGEIIYKDFGLPTAENMPDTKKNPFQEISLESIAKINPDQIILLHGGDKGAKLKDSPVWKNLKAVQQGKVHYLPKQPNYAQSYTPIGKELLLDQLQKLLLQKQG